MSAPPPKTNNLHMPPYFEADPSTLEGLGLCKCPGKIIRNFCITGNIQMHAKSYPGRRSECCQEWVFQPDQIAKSVRIDREKMSQMIVQEKLLKRAVVKEDELG